MAADDFEVQFSRLGLSNLNSAVDATFVSGEFASTLPRTGAGSAGHAVSSTMPRLTLSSPDAAIIEGEDPAELVVVNVLGEGGMGQVLLARQHSLGREVAVKVLKPGTGGAAAADALVEEARTTGSLEHPNIVPVYALARDATGLPALVMKRIDGVSWRSLLQDAAHPSWERIATGRDRLEANLEVLIQVCNAIAHAHHRGVIHRDLKPANILIGELGEVYVADWGVAIQKARLEPGPPRLVGTPAYLAPEMVTGDPSMTDERTDIYLLGGTLHEVLTGRPTHLGENVHDVLQKAFVAAAPTLPAELPAELAALCTRALAADPRHRFQTALEMRDALRLFLQHRGSIRLADAASQRLERLEGLAATPLTPELERAWYALISECRFGFVQALDADPQSPVALAGLERCLEVATAREVERGSSHAARAFLVEMKSPSTALDLAVRGLESRDAQRVAREAHHRQEAHELNPRVSVRQRNQIVITLAITVGLIVLVFGAFPSMREATNAVLGRWSRLVPMGIVGVVYVSCLILWRQSLFATRINRQLMALIGVSIFSMELGRIQFLVLDLPLKTSLVHDAWMMATVLAVSAFLLHWGFAVTGLIFLVAGMLIGASPEELSVPIFSSASMLGLVSAVLMFQVWLKDLEKAKRV